MNARGRCPGPRLFTTLPALTDGVGACGVPVGTVDQFIAADSDLLPGHIHIGAALVLAGHEHGSDEQRQAKG